MAKKRVNLYMEEALIEGLDEQAKFEGRTKTEIVRRALEEYFVNHPVQANVQGRQQRMQAQLAALNMT